MGTGDSVSSVFFPCSVSNRKTKFTNSHVASLSTFFFSLFLNWSFKLSPRYHRLHQKISSSSACDMCLLSSSSHSYSVASTSAMDTKKQGHHTTFHFLHDLWKEKKFIFSLFWNHDMTNNKNPITKLIPISTLFLLQKIYPSKYRCAG